jgi:hypothetical protein
VALAALAAVTQAMAAVMVGMECLGTVVGLLVTLARVEALVVGDDRVMVAEAVVVVTIVIVPRLVAEAVLVF